MIEAVELQVISRILTSDSKEEVDKLCSFGLEYYSVYKEHAEYIFNHIEQYGDAPDVFTFQAQFPDINLVKVSETTEYLIDELNKNRQHILLIETFNKLKNLGSGDVTEAWKYLAMQCEKVNALDSSDPMDIVHDAKERAAKVIEFSKQERIPTGFAEIDKLMYGGLSTVEELLLILARTNTGKAQPLWSKVLTPSGWTTIGNLRIGDRVVGENNDVGEVVEIYPQGEKDYYRVNFDDGTSVECCDDHLWKVLDRNRRISGTKAYSQHIIAKLRDIRTSLDAKYSVDISDAIEFESDFDEESELDGYLLGCILTAGDVINPDEILVESSESKVLHNLQTTIYVNHQGDSYLEDSVSTYGVVIADRSVKHKLQEYGLWTTLMYGNDAKRFIPEVYFTAPIRVRMSLLEGMVDTCKHAVQHINPMWGYSCKSLHLIQGFVELARSLGVKVTYTSDVDYKSIYTASCRSDFNPYRFSSKHDNFQKALSCIQKSSFHQYPKMIKSVDYVGKTRCQCILLDNKTHTYITDGYTITHNSWVCTKMMESSQKNGFPVLYYSPEMQASYLGTRFDTWRAHFQNSQLYQGKYTPQYTEYIESLEGESTSAFVLEDKDVAGGIVNTRVVENLVKKHKIKLIIIDGLSYMEDIRRSTSDYEKYKNLCLDLFRISKKYSCAVVIAMQANRATSENKDDKGLPFPSLWNIEGSDHPGRIATQAFSLRQIFEKHVLDIRLEKSRIANNQQPVLSYAWDVNTGNMQYLPGGDDDPVNTVINTTTVTPKIVTHESLDSEFELDDDDFDDDDVEF